MWLYTWVGVFVVGYPIFVSAIWIVGCLFSIYLQHHQRQVNVSDAKTLVSVLVPAHNEHDTLRGAVMSVSQLRYKHIEIIMIDDKSTDDTLDIMAALKQELETPDLTLKIVAIPENHGKANALNEGLKVADGDYILGIDSDSILDYNALTEIIQTLESNDHIGAVAGKPVVRNRTTILGRLQLLEYIGVIDIIKRAQAFLTGRITTVSGVIVGFRKAALESVGGWNTRVMTEDIDITWRMYRQGWQVRYNPQAICWILVPENVRNLIKQRTRWARGGLEVLVGNRDVLIHGAISKKVLLTETFISNLWAVLTAFSTVSYLLSLIFVHELNLAGNILLILLFISFFQFILGFISSRRATLLQFRDLLLIPIYVVYYWMINLISCLSAIVSFFLDPEQKGTWRSPDRGL